MKKLITILALLISFFASAQTTPTSIVSTTTQLQNYNGSASMVFVSDSAYQGLYYIYPGATAVNNITIFSGTGGRKWRRGMDPSKASLSGATFSGKIIVPHFDSDNSIVSSEGGLGLQTLGPATAYLNQNTVWNLPSAEPRYVSTTSSKAGYLAIESGNFSFNSSDNIAGITPDGYIQRNLLYISNVGVVTIPNLTNGFVKATSGALSVSAIAISDITALQAAIDGKAALGHSHTIGDIAALQDALDGKAELSHIHDDRYYTETETDVLLATKAATAHAHTISDVTGLQAALDAKAATSHAHAGEDITSGTVADARLSANIPLLNGANLWVNNQTITKTTEQLRLRYDGTQLATFTVSSTGLLSITTNTSQVSLPNTKVAGLFTGAMSGIDGNLSIFSIDGLSGSISNAGVLIGGAAGTQGRIFMRGATATTLTADRSVAGFIIGTHGYTEAATGSHPLVTQLAVKPIVATNGAGATTDAATVYIEGALSGVTPSGRNDAFRVNAGLSYFGGGLEISGATSSLLLSRLTTTERDALSTTGIIVYDATTNKFTGRNNSAWGYFSLEGHTHVSTDIDATVSTTEFGYINTLSSNAQTQIDAKAPIAAPSFTTSIQAPIVILPSQAEPSTTAASSTVFSEDVAGRDMAGQVAPNQYPYHFQPSFNDSRMSYISYQNNTTSSSNVGLIAGTAVGTLTAVSAASTRYHTRISRIKLLSAATAGASAELFGTNQARWTITTTAGMGGFAATFNFGISHAATVANARCFVGFEPSAAGIPNVEPSSLINIIGAGTDAGGTTLKIFHNDGSGTATTIDLGANFPINTLSTDWYRVTFYADPGTGSAPVVHYRVVRRNTYDASPGTSVATGTITTNLPVDDVFMNWHVNVNNGSTALASAIDFSYLVIETKD